jgi:transposase-like protein
MQDLNNVVEQDHRTVKRRVWLAKGLWLIAGCLANFAGYRSGVAMIRKGRVRWLAKGDAVGQAHVIAELLFGIAA